MSYVLYGRDYSNYCILLTFVLLFRSFMARATTKGKRKEKKRIENSAFHVDCRPQI